MSRSRSRVPIGHPAYVARRTSLRASRAALRAASAAETARFMRQVRSTYHCLVLLLIFTLLVAGGGLLMSGFIVGRVAEHLGPLVGLTPRGLPPTGLPPTGLTPTGLTISDRIVLRG